MARVRNSKNKYISKGERRSSIKTAEKTAVNRLINQQKAHNSGKRVIITIENPNKQETNKRFIRVLSSAVWSRPKERRLVF
jgi:lipopolysaccharide export LptBFGC system permease protein LptF